MKTRIQSVEVSYFIHATEDPGKLEGVVMEKLGLDIPPRSESLEGHYGNTIRYSRHHLTGEEAESTLSKLIGGLGAAGRQELIASMPASIDEHGALYIRLDKQSFFGKKLNLGTADPVRVRVKPRLFGVGPSAAGYFRELIGREE